MDEQWKESLASAARKLHYLLRDVDSASAPLWSGRALDAAIHRYVEIFLPMLAAHAARSEARDLSVVANRKLDASLLEVLSGDMYLKEMNDDEQREYIRPFMALGKGKNVVAVPPIPPLDVAFCWALHRLSPMDYAADCRKLFGAPLPTENGLDYISVHNADEERALIARLQWYCFAHAVRQMEPFKLFTFKKCRRERKTFLPSYLWPPYEEDGNQVSFGFTEHSRIFEKKWTSPLSYDLKAAVARQKQFLYNVSHSYFDADESLKRGATRYSQFLMLMRDNPGKFLVPMYDIDLVWHAHMLRDTKRYAEDTRNFVGQFVNHKEDDDRREGGELDTGFTETAQLWKAKYGEEYEDENTNYKGRISDSQVRVYSGNRAVSIKHDDEWRKSFVERAVVCAACGDKIYKDMHNDCRKKLAKAVKLARGGQVRGGACAALYGKGYIGSAALYSRSGGACGAFLGNAHGGCGCGGGGDFGGAACGAGGCAGGAGGCGGAGGGCGGGGCGGGGGGCGGGGCGGGGC